jgi:hypothetical protein
VRATLEVLKFIFEDFWRFLGCCVFLMIFALWKPVEVNILNGFVKGEDEDDA